MTETYSIRFAPPRDRYDGLVQIARRMYEKLITMTRFPRELGVWQRVLPKFSLFVFGVGYAFGAFHAQQAAAHVDQSFRNASQEFR